QQGGLVLPAARSDGSAVASRGAGVLAGGPAHRPHGNLANQGQPARRPCRECRLRPQSGLRPLVRFLPQLTQLAESYSSLMSAALMTSALRPVSSIRCLVIASGVWIGTTTLIERILAIISSLLAISTIFELSVATISLGVP